LINILLFLSSSSRKIFEWYFKDRLDSFFSNPY